jgi:uncharacterized protein DUF6916
MANLEWLTCADFAGRVGDHFDVTAGDASGLPIELVEASESTEAGGRGPDGATRLQFSLVFRGPAAPLLPQATYRLSHPELGELDLFLVPAGAGPHGVTYAAAFA